MFGSGAWGFALADVLAIKGHATTLWGRPEDHIEALAEERRFPDRLPGCTLHPDVVATPDLNRAIRAERYICAIPTAFLRGFLTRLPRDVPGRIWINGGKGIEQKTLKTPGQIITDSVHPEANVYSLSGPSHAEELARRMPTSVVLAGTESDERDELQEEISTDYFRLYASADRYGVELAGALKNVVALASGICDGLGFGDNTRGALITRGLAEMTRLGQKLGGRWETFAGLAGMGDLITTCTSEHSRNRQVGLRLGRGETLSDILASMTQIAEGVNTTPAARDLGAQQELELPITEEVYAVLYEGRQASDAARSLMTRTLKEEATTYAG